MSGKSVSGSERSTRVFSQFDALRSQRFLLGIMLGTIVGTTHRMHFGFTNFNKICATFCSLEMLNKPKGLSEIFEKKHKFGT